MSYLFAITLFHTAISIVAIVAGVFAVVGLFQGGAYPLWTRLFLVTAIVTSVTGFFFPPKGLTPAEIVGALALVILALVLVAQYRFAMAGIWRWVYAGGMVASLYLLVFVGIVQAFQKIPFLHVLAPAGSEPPFAATQGATLLAFVVIGALAALRYRPQARTLPA